MRRRLVLACVTLLVAGPSGARAQQLRGVVRDSATQTPLGGAVITLVDASGGALARAISNENGLYVVGPTTGARTVRLLRIGFRPRTVPFTEGKLDIAMSPIPPLLEPVTVRAATNCPARPDRIQALSLLQQARAGLLATVTARETNRATLVRLTFVRDYEERGRGIAEQRVWIDSTAELSESFGAVRSGAEFVAEGFGGRTDAGNPVHYGPDAETLLDDDFAAGYCFQISDAEAGRPTEIGLAFTPASRKKGRVDVQGTLWVDTVSKSLRDIVFEYVGDTRPFGAPETGGHIEFREMGNGIVIVDRWDLRLFASRLDSVQRARGMEVRPVYHIREAGGEVATATWSDGFHWDASLGSLRAVVVDDRARLAPGVIVRLRDTDYLETTNARGVVEIPYLLPGPYIAVVTNSTLQRLGITLPTTLTFTASRDSLTERRLSLPRPEDFVLGSCLGGVSAPTEQRQLSMRVVDASGKPVANATVDISLDDDGSNQAVRERLGTDSRGAAASCLIFEGGDRLQVTVTRGSDQPYTETFRYHGSDIVIRLRRRR
jgi:hypothetical protein